MIWKNSETVIEEMQYGEVKVLEYPLLRKTGIVKHCFTTRAGGVSSGIFASMNVSFTRGDKEEDVKENYRRIAETLGTKLDDFVCTDQTHTTNIRVATKEDRGKGVVRKRDYHDIDGLITKESGLVLSAFFADCVPLYFVDTGKKAIGLSHSGWRGTVGKMANATIEAMKREFGTNPADLVCAIGPSICPDCYEVSSDVAEQFETAFSGKEGELLRRKENGKYLLNLWRANELQLIEAGVPQEQIAVTNLCTCCNPEQLFSHRASHGKRGNLGAFLCLTEESH